MKERIIIVAHGHPKEIKGGAEVAAYNLFLELKNNPNVEEVVFIARTEGNENNSTPFVNYDKDEILFASSLSDHFRCSQANKSIIWNDFRSFLESFKPTIVHFHHYIHLGLEMLKEVKNYSQNTKLFVTLHEYIAICYNNGLMIKRGSTKLCHEFKPIDCSKCFTDIQPSEFFLREQYFKAHFQKVDGFISPSNFLKERYVSWGLPENKITVIENGVQVHKSISSKSKNKIDKISFGYFGQINPNKGLDILLKAIQLLSEKQRDKIVLNIHGANLEKQDAKFQRTINNQLDDLNECVTYYGEYEQAEIPYLMENIDCVIIPSKWWENSPVIIQESFANKTPIICSNIGGMKEKVMDGLNGIHFRVNNHHSLAEEIAKVIENPKLLDNLKNGIQPVLSKSDCASKHIELYSGAI